MSLPLCPVYAVGVDDWLTILLACGLTARLTRLITLDTITQPIRDRLKGLLSVLAECPWCSGFWVSVAVGLSWIAWSDQTWWQVAALVGTLSFVAGAVAGAGGPSQHEIAVMGAVPLINADDPIGDNVEVKNETVFHVDGGTISEDQLADAVAHAMNQARRQTPRPGNDEGADGSY